MRPRFDLVVAVLALAGLAGCKPKIGDKCQLSTDCSVMGDRLCDTTQPDGYCTIFNCEPGQCPVEAVCVEFDVQVDPAPACQQPGRLSRFERTFCMRTCDTDGDCRGGYTCADPDALSGSFNGRVVDRSAKVCVANAPKVSADPSGAGTGVCTGSWDGGTVPLWDAGADLDAGVEDAADDADAGEDAAADGSGT